ncbi:hypothetical protein [Teredinibacter turnerae]|uniref:hypothetical protein n=1 Tax=Teredinibacter turnerae TaxID=2426 RepID=UPI0030CE6085
MSALVKTALALFATAACIISGWLTVQLVTSVQPGALAAAAGITFHGMQYVLAAAARTLTGNPLTKLVTWCATACLLTLSVGASVKFLESGYQTTASHAASIARQTTRLAALDDSIKTRNAIAAQYADIDYLKSSAAQLDKLQSSIESANALDAQLTAQPKQSLADTLALTASTLHVNQNTLRLALFLAIGSLLDITGMLSIFYLFQTPQRPATPQVASAATEQPNQSQREQLMQRIVAGEFGPEPTQTEIVKATNTHKSTVSRAFSELRASGKMVDGKIAA